MLDLEGSALWQVRFMLEGKRQHAWRRVEQGQAAWKFKHYLMMQASFQKGKRL